MKRFLLFRVVLSLFLVAFIVNAGTSKTLALTPVKVKELIAKKVNEVLDDLISSGDTDLSAAGKKLLAEFRPMVINAFLISGILPEGKHYIAAFTINIPDEPAFILNFKIKKGKSGWEIHEFQEMDSQWQPVKVFVSKLRQYLKGSLYMGKQKTTMLDLKTISRAIENYMRDKHHAPRVNSIKELERVLEPVYIKTLPLNDAWGNEFFYKVDKDNPRRYWIASGGSDGKFAGFDQTGVYTVSTFEEFANDFIFSDGRFVFAPRVRGSD